jgi:tetratricopeptide (TPR) repeat protein
VPVAASSRRDENGREHTLLGRERHVRELGLLLDALVAGRGNLVLVAGDAGMGKTRLVEEGMRLAREAGVDAARVTCWAEAGAPPFWPWAELLRATVDRPVDLADVDGAPGGSPDRELARFRLFDAVWRDLQAAARARPLLLVIDDLHWADMPSLRLLAFLAPLLHEITVGVLAAYRDTEADLELSLGAVLPDLVRHGRHLVLPPLTAEQMGALVTDLRGTAPADDEIAHLHWLTGGNPLFAHEVVSLGNAEQAGTVRTTLPESVRATLTRRLELVSPACRQVLDVAAVVGVEFALGVFEGNTTATGTELLELLDEAVRARLVREVGLGRFEFAHPLTRETAYQHLGLARRVRLHQQVGESLERLRATGVAVDQAELAYHFRNAAAGGNAAKALEYAEEAARRAMAMLAYEAAVSHYEDALAALALGAVDPGRRTGLLLQLGEARVAAGDLASARAAFTEGAVLAREQGRPEQLARAALGLGAGPSGFEVAQFDDAQVALLEDALEAIGDSDSTLRAWLLARLSVAAGLGGSGPERRVRAERAIAMVRDAGEPAALAYALSAHCDTIAGPDFVEQRLDEATEIVALARSSGDPRMELLGRRLRVVALLELGATSEVDAEIELYARTADAIRQPLYAWYIPLWRGMRALMDARFNAARHWCAEAERMGLGSHSDNALMLTATLRMWIDVHTGNAGTALTRWDELMRHWPDYTAMTRMPRAAMLWHAGEVDAARATVDQVRIEEVTEESFGAEWLECLAMLGDVVGRLEGHALAPRLYEELLPHRRRFAIDGIGGHVVCVVEHPLALLARALGRNETREHFDAAIEAYRRVGATLLLSQALADAGDTPAAPSPLGERHGEFRRDGDVWIVGYEGRSVQLRHTKGMADIARLLAQPGREIQALDLMSDGAPTLTSAGIEALDEQARAAYKRRLVELESELESADAEADIARSELLGAEREAVLAELSGAYGIGGRTRRAGGSADRARSAVTQRIKDALGRIARAHPEAGRHLQRSLRTGTFCVYEPDGPVSWAQDLRA